MKKWCHSALEREHGHILQGLTRGLASLATQGGLYRHVGRLTSLVSILEALGEPAEPTSHAQAQPSRELILAQQLHQCAQVSPSLANRNVCISPTFFGMYMPSFQGCHAEGTEKVNREGTCGQVLEWVAQHVAHAGGSPGRYASDQEWRSAVNKRRNAAHPATPFLQDLLQELASQHVSPSLYMSAIYPTHPQLNLHLL